MSEEESENSKNEENEDEENEEGEGEGEGEEGEEKEGEENEDGEEGEEKEDDEEGEDKEDEEGEGKEDDEEEEDEEDDKKKKKKKKGKNEKEEKKEEEKIENGGETQIKFPETKLSPTKEIKMDLNLNLNNSENIYFNGNDFTLANVIPKKSTLQLLMEISSDMDALTSHLEQVLPSPMKYNIDYKITNPILDIPKIPVISTSPLPPVPNYDLEDIEIKKLINKANQLTNNSILHKNNIDINNSMSNNEIKIYEDKGCQSDNEMENSYHNKYNEDDMTQQEYYNDNENNRNGIRYPYDPYKHIDYYNDLRNNYNGNYENQFGFNDNNKRRMDQFYRRNNSFSRNIGRYEQPEFNNNINSMRNMDYPNFNKENNLRDRDMEFQRYKPGSINHAMDILLDKK